MAFKIALTAGHYMGTPGKRCMKKLDPNQTREWWLNNRVADKIENLLKGYTGWELLRTDDTTGKKNVSLRKRTDAANKFKADFYLSIHHNAGIKGGSGGGVVAFVYTKASAESGAWQKALYKALIDATGLKGNRSNPTPKKNLHEVRETDMPAVLLELGFMDSKTDVPIILTDAYADKCAGAIVKVLVEKGKLEKKAPASGYTQEQFIREVQKAIGAVVDGIAGPETLSKTVTVSEEQNAAHAVVKPIQKWLATLGYDAVGKADGIAGPLFTAAVTDFQAENGCVKDGIITARNKTWKKLLGKDAVYNE